MSIRPVNYEELPETSFEDMDTTFTKDVLRRKHSPGQISPISRQQHHNGLIPTPSSTSSDGTVFSSNKNRHELNNKTDEEEEEDDEDFLDDFQEFRNRKDDFDDALQNYFRSQKEPHVYRKGSTVRSVNAKISDLANEFDSRVTIGPNKARRPRAIRQPRSMMNLNTHSRHGGNNGGIVSSNAMPNSISTGDLRVKSNGTVRFKKSMPTLSSFNPTIEEEEEEEEEEEATFRGERARSDNDYLKHFMEVGDEENDDGFIFDESLIQPQFLSKTSEASPLKLSPSQYDIIRDDTLLTPRLHKRHKEWNSRQQLDSFKEQRATNARRKSNKGHTAASRIRIIKQEIDHNTPIKNGRMYYNPKTMKWEGNEQVLDKFRKLDSIDKKPLLIKTKSQLNDGAYEEDLAAVAAEQNSKLKPKKSFTNSKIVGKMMFDEDNLRWVSVHGQEEESDPFAGIADVLPTNQTSPNGTFKLRQQASPFHRSQSQLLPSSSNSALDRLNSQATTRYHSMGTSINREGESNGMEPAFQLNSRLLEKFCHEENRWNRKVGGWFILGNKESEASTLGELDKTQKHRSYMFEIRNMVINSTRG